MKNNIYSKIKQFLESEDGRVSAKAPLALGIAAGSVLLAQMIVPAPSHAGYYECVDSGDCDPGEDCIYTCRQIKTGTIRAGSLFPCLGTWSSACV